LIVPQLRRGVLLVVETGAPVRQHPRPPMEPRAAAARFNPSTPSLPRLRVRGGGLRGAKGCRCVGLSRAGRVRRLLSFCRRLARYRARGREDGCGLRCRGRSVATALVDCSTVPSGTPAGVVGDDAASTPSAGAMDSRAGAQLVRDRVRDCDFLGLAKRIWRFGTIDERVRLETKAH
jgi:hypothetical protein